MDREDFVPRFQRQKRLLLIAAWNAPMAAFADCLAERGGWRVACAAEADMLAIPRRTETPTMVVVDRTQAPIGASTRVLCETLRGWSTEMGVLLLVGAEREERLKAFRAGADDCMSAPVDGRELRARVDALSRRLPAPRVMSHSDMTALVKRAAQSYRLSPKEQQVLELLLQGKQPKEMGEILGCAHSSIRTHVSRMCAKACCSKTSEFLLRLFLHEEREELAAAATGTAAQAPLIT